MKYEDFIIKVIHQDVKHDERYVFLESSSYDYVFNSSLNWITSILFIFDFSEDHYNLYDIVGDVLKKHISILNRNSFFILPDDVLVRIHEDLMNEIICRYHFKHYE